MAWVYAAAAAALRRTGRPRVVRPRGLEWVALALLGVQTVWAAFPDYRYDQWNYHLVVPKAVAHGPLAPPVLNDHLFFTGSYEYLFTLARRLNGDDIFNQCFAGCFTIVAILQVFNEILHKSPATDFSRTFNGLNFHFII